MTKKEISNVLQKGRLPFDSDFWWDYVTGTSLLSGLTGAIGMLALQKLGFSTELAIPLFIAAVGLISVRFYVDHQLQFIKTGLSKQENIDLICNTLDSLGWAYSTRANSINLEYNKYILKWIWVLILPLDGRIAYVFQYHSAESVRFPFFVGIRTYLKKKFETKLYVVLASAKAK